MYLDHSPVQVLPSPSKPFLQRHKGPLLVSLHLASMEQPPFFTSHEPSIHSKRQLRYAMEV